ncbi:putative ribonuclease H-like domain-containing protein [Tanacetum coccineum]
MPYVSAASTPTGANAGESSFVYLGGQISIDAYTLPNADLPTDPNKPDLEDVSNAFINDGIFSGAYDDDDVGAEANFNNMDHTIDVSPIPTLRIHKVEAMQEEFLQFKLQKVWVLVDLPYGKKEEGIDYDEVFAPVARIEVISLFLAFASYMGFTIYQMDVKSSFLYDTIGEEVYVQQPPGFVDHADPNKVYKESYTRQSMCTEFEECMHKRFQMSSMGELTFFLGLQVHQQHDGIFISQDKYVADILKMFDFCYVRTATTLIESNKPLVQDEDGVDVDVLVYRSMIGSLMYLTASRPDIMFAVCACARFQVTPKASHLNEVKRIFRYLKHQPKLELWYPRDSPFELDCDYKGASLDRKSTTGGCQFLSRRLISWQCKKQTIVANSTTEAEYVTAANCYGNSMDLRMDGSCASNFSHIWVVLSLMYALTLNLLYYDSLVKQFWQTATVRTLANGTPELVASIDDKEYTITDEDCQKQLDRQDTEIPRPSGLNFSNVADEAYPLVVRVGTKGATTTISSLDAGLDSGNIHESPLRSHEAALHKGHTLGCVKDSLQLKELMVLVPKLVTRINLEKELHQTKTTYWKAVLTLVER